MVCQQQQKETRKRKIDEQKIDGEKEESVTTPPKRQKLNTRKEGEQLKKAGDKETFATVRLNENKSKTGKEIDKPKTAGDNEKTVPVAAREPLKTYQNTTDVTVMKSAINTHSVSQHLSTANTNPAADDYTLPAVPSSHAISDVDAPVTIALDEIPDDSSPCLVNHPTSYNCSVSSKAKTLLVDGRMPLLPPGKRDWQSVPDESVQLCDRLVWPPKGWMQLSADQKLLAWEYAAMLLSQPVDSSSLCVSERTHLLHRYMFLMLPDTADSPLNTFGKQRAGNYEAVRLIALGQADIPDHQESIVNALSAVSVNSDLPSILTTVPLRLE